MSTFEERIEIREQIDSDGWFLFFRAVERGSGRNLMACRPAPELVSSSGQVMERFHGRLAILRGAEFVVAETIVDGGVDAEGPVFATNEFEGMLLSQKTGSLSQGEFKRIAECLCEGLVEIHDKGVAHGCLSSGVVRVSPEGTRVCLGGVMRTVFAGVVEDPSGRSMRECDLAQLAVILAEVLGIEIDQVGGLAGSDPNAAFIQSLLLSGFPGGVENAGQALNAAKQLPTNTPVAATPAPPPSAQPNLAPRQAGVQTATVPPAASQPAPLKLATGPVVGTQSPAPQQAPVAPVATGNVQLTAPASLSSVMPGGGVVVQKKNKLTKYVLGGVALAVLATVGFLVMSHIASRNAEEKRGKILAELTQRFEAAGLGEKFYVSEEEMEILLGSLKGTSSGAEQPARMRIVQAAHCEGSDRDGELILKTALTGELNDQIRSQLFALMKERNIYFEVGQILDWANKSGSGQPISLQAAGELIAPKVGSENLKDLLRAVESSNPEVSQFAISAMSRYLQDDSNDSALVTKEILSRYRGVADSKERGAYLKLLIASGSDEALEATSEAMQGKDAFLQSIAFKSMRQWPDDRGVELLLAQIEKTTDPKLRSEIFQSLAAVAGDDRHREDSQQERAWKAAASAAGEEDEKLFVLKGLESRKEEWAFYIVEFFMSDAENKVSQKAESTYERMETNLRNIKR